MPRTRIRCCVQNCCDRSGAGQAPAHPFKRWLFAGLEVKGTQGPHTEEKELEHPWRDVFTWAVGYSATSLPPSSVRRARWDFPRDFISQGFSSTVCRKASECSLR